MWQGGLLDYRVIGWLWCWVCVLWFAVFSAASFWEGVEQIGQLEGTTGTGGTEGTTGRCGLVGYRFGGRGGIFVSDFPHGGGGVKVVPGGSFAPIGAPTPFGQS